MSKTDLNMTNILRNFLIHLIGILNWRKVIWNLLKQKSMV